MFYKIALALKNVKELYRKDNIIIGFDITDKVYKLYTINGRKLIFFDKAKTVDEVMFKLQILKEDR